MHIFFQNLMFSKLFLKHLVSCRGLSWKFVMNWRWACSWRKICVNKAEGMPRLVNMLFTFCDAISITNPCLVCCLIFLAQGKCDMSPYTYKIFHLAWLKTLELLTPGTPIDRLSSRNYQINLDIVSVENLISLNYKFVFCVM